MKAIALATFALTLATAELARATDTGKGLDAPAPPTLPALAHQTLTYTFELTGAGINATPNATTPIFGAASTDVAYAWFLHNQVEYPLRPRSLYVGGAHDLEAGAVPGVGTNSYFGSPELWVRALWSSVVGLSSGGGLGIVMPLPHDLAGQSAKVFDTLRVVRPWDAAHFTDLCMTFRPWIDVRHMVGRFIFQLRQGMDIALVVRDLKPGERRIDYIAQSTAYAGYRVTRELGVGIEAWEVYQITANVPDDSKRAAVGISPSIRFLLGRVEPALSLLVPVTAPLRGDAASYFAARFNIAFEFDVARPRSP